MGDGKLLDRIDLFVFNGAVGRRMFFMSKQLNGKGNGKKEQQAKEKTTKNENQNNTTNGKTKREQKEETRGRTEGRAETRVRWRKIFQRRDDNCGMAICLQVVCCLDESYCKLLWSAVYGSLCVVPSFLICFYGLVPCVVVLSLLFVRYLTHD